MAAVKWIFVALFSLGALGALGMGFTSTMAREPKLATPPAIALRAFPSGSVAAGAAPAVAPKPAEPEKTPEPVAAKAPEPAKTPEPVAAKPPEPAKTPEPVAAKPPEPAKTPEPVAAKPPEPAKTPEPVAAKPPAPAPAPVAAKPPPPAAADGVLNLRASDTADVYLDGRKLGGSPLLGVKAKVGNHKVRFDCYDAAGNTVAGPVQTVAVKAEGEVEVEFTCPTE